MKSKSAPDRCLICYSSVTSSLPSASAKRKRRHETQERESLSSVLFNQLHNVFILKDLLEIPSQNLQTFLKICGMPEMWVCICPSCETLIDEAKRINDDMVKVNKRFKMVKKRLIEAIQKSKTEQNEKTNLNVRKRKLPNRLITDESRSFVSIHEYGHFTDPFIFGDKRANQLVKKNMSEESQSNARRIEVKIEVPPNDCSWIDMDENEALFYDIDDTDLIEDCNDTDLTTHNTNTESESNRDVGGKEASSDTPEKFLETKYCDKCEVNFIARYFEKHLKSVHDSANVILDDQTEQNVNNIVAAGMCKEKLLTPFVESALENDGLKEAGEICDDEYDDVPLKPTTSTFDDGSLNEVTQRDQKSVSKRRSLYSLSCLKCPREFFDEEKLLEHQGLHKTSPFHCFICLSVLKTYACLLSHLCVQHPSTTKRNKRDHSATMKTNECNIDFGRGKDKSTKSSKSIKRRKEKSARQKLQKQIFECDVCKSQLATAKLLRSHRMRVHRLDLLVCDICGKECNSEATLKDHMDLHQDVKKFACQHCDRSFIKRHYLRNHTFKMHTPRDAQVNPLVCPHCDKAFNCKAYMKQHVAELHEGQFKILCNICPAGFSRNSQLKKHMAVKHQIGEIKRFPCTEEGCDKKFLCRKALKEHTDRHAGKPQYKCRFCPKEFFDSSHFRRHENIHTNSDSKPYVCEICAKRFPVRMYLYTHMKSHKKETK